MTDFDPYVADPAEPAARERLAHWRPVLSWLSALLIVAAMVFVWVRNSGSEDPSLDVPVDQLTPAATAPADPGAAPAAPAPGAPPP